MHASGRLSGLLCKLFGLIVAVRDLGTDGVEGVSEADHPLNTDIRWLFGLDAVELRENQPFEFGDLRIGQVSQACEQFLDSVHRIALPGAG